MKRGANPSELDPEEFATLVSETARQKQDLIEQLKLTASNRMADALSELIRAAVCHGGEHFRKTRLQIHDADYHVSMEVAARLLGLVDEAAEHRLAELARIADRPTAHTASLLLDGWQTCFSKSYGVDREAERRAILGIGPRQAFCDENPAIPLAWGSWGSKMVSFVDLRGRTTEQLVERFCELSVAYLEPSPGSESRQERHEQRMPILRFLGLLGRDSHLLLTRCFQDPRPAVRFSGALFLLGVSSTQAMTVLADLAESQYRKGEGGPERILREWRASPWKTHFQRFVWEDPHPADLQRAAKGAKQAKRAP
jgi:hypothetical protein